MEEKSPELHSGSQILDSIQSELTLNLRLHALVGAGPLTLITATSAKLEEVCVCWTLTGFYI